MVTNWNHKCGALLKVPLSIFSLIMQLHPLEGDQQKLKHKKSWIVAFNLILAEFTRPSRSRQGNFLYFCTPLSVSESFSPWKNLLEKTWDVVSSSWFNVLYSPTITSPDVLWLSLELHTLMSPDFVFPMHCVANHSIADVYISIPLCTLLFCTASPISFPVYFSTYFPNNFLTKKVKNTGF